jgi:hypothetical protein
MEKKNTQANASNTRSFTRKDQWQDVDLASLMGGLELKDDPHTWQNYVDSVLPLFHDLFWDQSYLFFRIYCGNSLTSFSGFIVGSILPLFRPTINPEKEVRLIPQ